MDKFSVEQLSEIQTLLDERYAVLKFRLMRLKPLYDKHHFMYLDVKKEMDLIDSIKLF